jgi:hypothetical protein
MTFDIEKFRIKPGQMDLFDNAPSTPILGTITDRPRNRASKKLSAVKGSVDLIQRYSSHYKPIIENLPVGEVVSIPFRTVTGVNLSVSGLNSAVTAWIATNWGTDSSTTHINRKTKAIEVLRLK